MLNSHYLPKATNLSSICSCWPRNLSFRLLAHHDTSADSSRRDLGFTTRGHNLLHTSDRSSNRERSTWQDGLQHFLLLRSRKVEARSDTALKLFMLGNDPHDGT